MAHIVPFRTTARGAEDADAVRAKGAQIVIFPGVRRERHAEVPDNNRPFGATDARRDWLVLPDELPAACP